ncbi:unnamed protein product [Rotaria sp. Silwood2]|nr:unnamed protein product [Rotaria sp. Silwood2]
MLAAGFQYTGDSDTARCEHCGLEAFNWTAEMNPFSIHSVESPHCSYVRSMKSSSLLVVRESFLSSTIVGQNTSISDEQENSFKRRKIDLKSRLNNLFEPDSLQQYRRHSFDDWPHHGILSSGYMIQAGFISCATGDQSVCPYCDLICEQWTPYVDNPSEVHKTLSPACLYVIEKLRLAEPPPIINGSTSSVTASVSNPIHASNNTHSPLLSTFARPVVQNQNRSANHTLVTSTPACPVDKSLSIEELIQANTTSMVDQSDVNKFCCKDLLEHWDPDDDSKVEDDRWFPHWANGKQLYGNELYRKIQKTTRKHQQLRAHLKRENEKVNPDVTKNTNPNPNSRQLFIYYPPSTTIHGMEEQQLIYEQAENYDDPLRCPVKLFEFYLTKCPESVKCRQDVLYLLPEATCVPESPLWFSSQPLSASTMDHMLTRIKTVRDVNDIHLSMSQTSFDNNNNQGRS